MQRTKAQRGRFLQNLPGSLGPWQTEQHSHWIEWWRLRTPGEGENESIRADGADEPFAPWTIDQPGVERVANIAFQHLEKMHGAGIGTGERGGDLAEIEKNEIHRNRVLLP